MVVEVHGMHWMAHAMASKLNSRQTAKKKFVFDLTKHHNVSQNCHVSNIKFNYW